MWLIIREKDGAVLGTNYNCAPPAPDGCVVKEWYGPEPPVHDPDEGTESYDPTVGLSTNHEHLIGISARLAAIERRLEQVEKKAASGKG